MIGVVGGVLTGLPWGASSVSVARSSRIVGAEVMLASYVTGPLGGAHRDGCNCRRSLWPRWTALATVTSVSTSHCARLSTAANTDPLTPVAQLLLREPVRPTRVRPSSHSFLAKGVAGGRQLPPCDRDQEFLLPPSLREWLPEDHVPGFVADAVASIDLSGLYASYREDGWGRAAFDPGMMVSILLYAYAVGERSSRASSGAAAKMSPSGCLPRTSSRPRHHPPLPRPP